MELRHLRYFIAVAEIGSLTEAAQRSWRRADRCASGHGLQRLLADLAEALAPGRLALAFLRVEPAYDLGYHVVDREPLIVLMPGGHPLTARDAVCPQDFVGEIFIGGANKATVLRAVTEDYLRRSGLDIKLDHGVEKYGDGHVPGRIHPRAGADARLCQESAALAYDYYLGHANGTTPDGRGLLEHLRREAR